MRAQMDETGRFAESPPGIRVLGVDDWGPPLPLAEGDATIRPIVWSGMGARERTLHHLRFGAGGRTIVLSHAGEAVYYVIEGAVTATSVGSGQDEVIDLVAGGMVHLEPGERYYLSAAASAVVIGGPCPVDDRPAEDDSAFMAAVTS